MSALGKAIANGLVGMLLTDGAGAVLGTSANPLVFNQNATSVTWAAMVAAGLTATAALVVSGQGVNARSFDRDNAGALAIGGTNATQLQPSSGVADGATAVGILFNNTVALANAAAKLASWQNNSVEKLAIMQTGELRAPGGLSLLASGTVADGAGVIGLTFNNTVALANATAKIASFQNNSVEKLAVMKDGSLLAAGAMLVDATGALSLGTAASSTSTVLGAAAKALRLLGMQNGTVGAALVVGGNAIAPTANIHHVGAGLIKNITVPATIVDGAVLYIVPDAAFTYDNTGNIVVPAGGGTATVNKMMAFVWDGAGAKWTPSY